MEKTRISQINSSDTLERTISIDEAVGKEEH